MALPFRLTRSVFVTDVSDLTAAADRIERALERLRAKRITRDGLVLKFRGGPFRRVATHNLLVPINSGRLRVEPCQSGVRIWYRLEFVHTFVVATMLVLAVFGPPMFSSPNVTSTEGALILFGAWLALFGGNLVVTLVRFPRWLRRVAAEPNKLDAFAAQGAD